MGIAPLTTDKLPSGEHTLLLMKDKYNPYEVKITIPDNDTLKMTPHLVGNFAMVEIQAVEGAEIWVRVFHIGKVNWNMAFIRLMQRKRITILHLLRVRWVLVIL